MDIWDGSVDGDAEKAFKYCSAFSANASIVGDVSRKYP
jgi:hypothetical protein